jgi:hypothetical protein
MQEAMDNWSMVYREICDRHKALEKPGRGLNADS